MRLTVYIDELFLVNFAADLAILRVTALAAREKSGWGRLSAASALGAAYGAGSAFAALGFLYGFTGRAAAMTLIVLAAFGAESVGKFLRTALVFCVVTFAFGGGVYALGLLTGGSSSSWRETLFLAAVTAAGEAVFRRFPATRRDRAEFQAKAAFLGREIEFRAAEDTGSSLRDPLTGRPAVIIGPDTARSLLPPGLAEMVTVGYDAASVVGSAPPETAPRLGVIPCGTVAESALLLTFRPDSLVIDGKKADAIIAVSRENISIGGCRAIIGA